MSMMEDDISKDEYDGVGRDLWRHGEFLGVNKYTAGPWCLGVVESKEKNVVVDNRSYKIALAAIYHGIPEDILLSLAEKETVKEAWEAVRVTCQDVDRVKKARIQTLRSGFEAMIMKDTDSLDDFYLEMSGLVVNICALGEEIAESYMVKKLLRAVPSNFLQISSTMEQFGDLEKMKVEETIGSLKTNKERLRGKPENNDG
ncbi:uncharacterized protein LOC141703965 [Apium graveolens]|uniref:uncharacterized protein LOC141703718 n=1 Tax=Apium graveolens TaxID=4045 RepID=UPI003D79AA28